MSEEFKSIYFGESAAEAEEELRPDSIYKGYLQVQDDKEDWVYRALETPRFLFIGDKGTGKSSLLWHLDSLSNERYDIFTRREDLKSFPFSNFNTSALSGASGIEKTTRLSWQWLLISQLLWIATEDKTMENNDALNAFMKWMTEQGFSKPTNFDDFVAQTRSTKTTIKGPGVPLLTFLGLENLIGTFSYEKTTNQRRDISFENIIYFAKEVLGKCLSENKYYLLLDGLDTSLFTNNQEKSLTAVSSLIEEAKSLNGFFRNNNLNFKIVVVCRRDLFAKLPLNNSNSIVSSYATNLRWPAYHRNYFEHNKLVELATLKATISLGRFADIRGYFSRDNVPDQRGNSYKAINLVLWHTRHTPRDFLRALYYIREAHDERNTVITGQELWDGLNQYSVEYFIQEIDDELKGLFSSEEIDNLKGAISYQRAHAFSAKNILGALSEVGYDKIKINQLISKLLDCSAIGLDGFKKEGKNVTPLFKYNNQHTMLHFNPSTKFRLHRGLERAMGVR